MSAFELSEVTPALAQRLQDTYEACVSLGINSTATHLCGDCRQKLMGRHRALGGKAIVSRASMAKLMGKKLGTQRSRWHREEIGAAIAWVVILMATVGALVFGGNYAAASYGVSDIATDTTYADKRFAYIVPIVATDTVFTRDTLGAIVDTFVRRRPTLDSIPSAAVYRAVYGAGQDSVIILTYDTLSLAVLDSAVVDSFYTAWSIDETPAYLVNVPRRQTTPQIYANQPAGFDSIMGRTFLAADEPSGWAGSGLSAAAFSIQDGATYNPDLADPTGAPSFAPTDTRIGEMKYFPSLCAGCGPFTQFFTIPPDSAYTELYVSWHFQVSSNFALPAGSSLLNKMFFVQLCDLSGNNCNNAIFPGFSGSQTSPWNVAFSTQGTAEPGDGAIRINAGQIVAGQWHHIEMYLKLNTTQAGGDPNADGLVRVWLDGTKKISRDTIRYRGNGPSSAVGEDYVFSGQIRWTGTYPAGGGQPPEKMYVWYAHWYASGK